jgi:hypothetical protein
MQPSEHRLPTMDEVQRRAEQLRLETHMAQIRHKLLVLSGKGGVGKSTVAAQLAVALARAGRRVGLLDIDIHGPSIPRLMGIEGNPLQLVGHEIIPAKLGENLAVMSIGFLLSSGRDPVIWRGPKKHGAIRQFLADVAWGELDYLVVDSPPGTGDEPLSIAQFLGSSAGASTSVPCPASDLRPLNCEVPVTRQRIRAGALPAGWSPAQSLPNWETILASQCGRTARTRSGPPALHWHDYGGYRPIISQGCLGICTFSQRKTAIRVTPYRYARRRLPSSSPVSTLPSPRNTRCRTELTSLAGIRRSVPAAPLDFPCKRFRLRTSFTGT